MPNTVVRNPRDAALTRLDELDPKNSVKAGTTVALPANTRTGNVLIADANGAFGTVDGVTINTNGTAGSNDGTEAGSDKILVKHEATGANNGKYFLSDPGSASKKARLTRTSDADASSKVTSGFRVFIDQGTVNADTSWVVSTDDPITLNTTSIAFKMDIVSDAQILATPMARIGTPTFKTIQEFANAALSVGLINNGGGVISDIGGENIKVTAGAGLIKATDSDIATILFFDWSEASSIAIDTDTTKFVGVQYNAGSPQVFIKSADSWDFDTEFPLGTVINEGGTLFITNNFWKTADAMTDVIERFYGQMPVERDNRLGGLMISGTGTRNIATTAGKLWDKANEFDITAKDTSVADTFDRYYRNGSGGFTKEAAQTQWNNTQWDDGDGGLATMTAGFYANQWFYLTLNDELLSMYGTNEYASEAEALNESPPSTVPARIMESGRLVGRIVFLKSASSGTIQSAFGVSFTGAVVSDHNNLANLQGGAAGEKFHITGDFNDALAGTSGTPSTSNKYVTADDATPTPAVSKIVRANGSNVLADGWISQSSVTQHVGALDHDSLLNYVLAQHRIINDSGSSTTELLSASKILAITAAISAGIDDKDLVATSTEGLGNITLSGEQTLNGVTTSGSRIAVIEQSTGADNGYYLTAAGAWSRTTDADSDAEVTNGMRTWVDDPTSTVYRHQYILVTADPITVGVTALTFAILPALDFGSSAGTVTEGNDSRVPSQDENNALVGTDGTPSTSNKYVTNSDSRNSDARTPVAHNHNAAVVVACLTRDETHTVITDVSPVSFVMPFGGTFQLPYAEIETAGTTGVVTIDVNKNGTTIFSTKITIDTTELTSRTAATPPVISGSSFSQYDKITVDIDGIHTTPGKGLTVYIPITPTVS